ncbi:hypothetical protein [Streptomyces sp. MS2.AVA.5]|uniref:Uncharacterized protein n=1 Tax=Streptomyces achmelvichensis TaxID=3134111 RepID=A0ACC6PL42_9ACTN
MTDKQLDLENARAYAQGEIFLLRQAGDGFDALVYNTTGFGPCPAEEFGAIDTEQLAQDTVSDRVWKNPRRFWMMDALTAAIAGEPRKLGGLMFNCLADMKMPADFDPQRDQSSMAYRPTKIHRNSAYKFLSGRPVFMLRSPDGITWVMQTFTDHVDHGLTESALPAMAERLTLPDGWTYKARTLDRDLTITTSGLANIVPDGLANMYQGCVDGVNNFDPWD